jgi:hypothetical protein
MEISKGPNSIYNSVWVSIAPDLRTIVLVALLSIRQTAQHLLMQHATTTAGSTATSSALIPSIALIQKEFQLCFMSCIKHVYYYYTAVSVTTSTTPNVCIISADARP